MGIELKDGFTRHPEWKRLYDAITPVLSTKVEWSYEELSAFAGVDIRTSRGRKQFDKFRKHALRNLQVWFDVVRTRGYRIVQQREHGSVAHNKLRRAKRQTAYSVLVSINTKLEELTEQQRQSHLAIMAAGGHLLNEMKKTTRETRKLAAAIDTPKLSAVDEQLKHFGKKEPN